MGKGHLMAARKRKRKGLHHTSAKGKKLRARRARKAKHFTESHREAQKRRSVA
jgi:hypothetical protein